MEDEALITNTYKIPREVNVEVSGVDAGPVLKLKHYLASSSTLTIVPERSHANLTIVDDVIHAINAIGVNRNQTAIIREETKFLAVEYPAVIKGKTPKVSKVPTVLANDLVVNTKGPVSAQISFSFDVGTDTPSINYVMSDKCENQIWIWANEACTTGVCFDFVGGGYIVPNIVIDGKRVSASSPVHPDPTAKAGDIVDIVTNERHDIIIYRNGVQVYTYSGTEYKRIIDDNVKAGRFVHVVRNGYAGADQNPQVTVSGGNISPLTLKSSNIDANGYAFWDVDYIGSPKYGYVYSLEDLNGNVVQDWTRAVIKKNDQVGKAMLTAPSIAPAVNVPYVYKLVEADAKGKPKSDALMLSMKRTRPGVPSIGSNVAGMFTPYRKTRVYTNMFEQCYVQNSANWNEYPEFINSPTKIDFMGNPLVSGLAYQLAGPEKEGNYTLEVTAKEGILLAQNIEYMPSGGACQMRSKTQNGPNSVLIGVNVQLESLLAGNTPMFALIFRNVEKTLPKGLFCCEVTDDKSQRFYYQFIDRAKKINGPMRHMDNNWANEAGRYDNGKDVWDQHRSRRGRIGAQLHGIPLEDMVELSVLTNRPVWFNINHGLLYTPAGEDYLRRSLNLIFNGVGGDLGYGVSKSLRHKIENGNENWNFGLGNWHFLAAKAKANGRGTWNNDGEKHGVVQKERLYNWIRCITLMMEVIPDYATFIDRLFGAQCGRGDMSYLSGEKQWDEAFALTDRLSIAAYLPGDPNAGFGAGQQPDSRSPEDVVIWLRKSLPKLLADLNDEVQYYRNTYNLPTDFYEWNIAFPAIGNRTAAEERIIKSSDVFYRFMKDEYIAGIVPIGGDSCIYSDDGIPSAQQSWYFYESSYTNAGNMSWQALLDFAKEKGFTPIVQ